MTTEQRLDRLERVAKLFVRAGIRYRRNLRQLDEKIGILVDAQIRNEDLVIRVGQRMEALAVSQARNDERFAKSDERFARNDERFAKFDERFAKFDERFAKSDKRIAKFQQQTDKTLEAIMMLLGERRNGSA